MGYHRNQFKNGRIPAQRCGRDAKVRFETQAAALQRAAEILASLNARCENFRAYHCIHCGGWHLTSKT